MYFLAELVLVNMMVISYGYVMTLTGALGGGKSAV